MESESSRDNIIRNTLNFKVQAGAYYDSNVRAAIITVELWINNNLEGYLYLDVTLGCDIDIENITLTMSNDCIFPLNVARR
ncbi:hypothetical protein [Lysinibacillus sp. LZ02]|uniref:hypothetical protein n=1 Tax=Lysinibacillus sp. LZ02 TaxID=3420668 RepID=UPI003D365555